MLALLTKRARGLAAGILVAIYAFGVLAPSMIFSFNSNASIIHSLTEVHGDLLVLHFHPHDDPGLPPPIEVFVVAPICASLVPSPPQEHLAGCGPVTLDRPPRPSVLA
jgi:hypothetical protein